MRFKSKIVSRGISIGEVYIFEPLIITVKEAYIEKGNEKESVALYEATREKAKAELLNIQKKLMEADEEKAKIFAAHIDILYDEAMDEEIKELIECEHYSPDFAVQTVYSNYANLLAKSKDKLISERSADIIDVQNRMLRCFSGMPEKNVSYLERPVIIASHNLLPSDTAMFDWKNVIGILTEIGGPTSHSAIIAKSHGIPALIGIPDLLGMLKHGEKIILDAVDGELIMNPSEAQLCEYEAKRSRWLLKADEIRKYQNSEPLTKDGVRIDIGLNISSASLQELEGACCSDFVGLFRTEFLYMGSEHMPTEDEQLKEYKKVLLAYGSRPVILRTLDIGGDKTLPYMELPKEDNPFLGNRALRLCFSNPDLFRTQLRAAFRASLYGNLWLMLPMVGSLDDVRRAKAIIESVRSELKSEGTEYSDSVKIGIMIEIPSIALIADLVAKEVDFASIGSNDLCQYLCAVDRLNPSVSEYYQSYHPAMFRTMRFAIEQFVKAGKPVCVCGELGGDPFAAPVLIGFGMRKLSMNISAVAAIKHVLSTLAIADMQAIADTVCNLETAADVENYLEVKIKTL